MTTDKTVNQPHNHGTYHTPQDIHCGKRGSSLQMHYLGALAAHKSHQAIYHSVPLAW